MRNPEDTLFETSSVYQDGMEVVTMAGVGEMLGVPQSGLQSPSAAFPDDQPLHAHVQQKEPTLHEDDDVEDQMDTDQESHVAQPQSLDLQVAGAEDEEEEEEEEEENGDDNSALEEEGSSNLEAPHYESSTLDDETRDNMECDDSEGPSMFIDEDSSSRVFGEEGPEGAVASTATPTPTPEGGRRNKRKNFKPRNIVYTYTDSEDADMSDSDVRCSGGRGGQFPEDDTSASEAPLDLSDAPTLRRSLLPRKLTPTPPVDLSGRGGEGPELSENELANPRLNSLLSRPVGDPAAAFVFPGLTPMEAKVPVSMVGPADDGRDASDMKEYAEQTMKRLLGLYGLHDFQENLTSHLPITNFYSGKILESLRANGNNAAAAAAAAAAGGGGGGPGGGGGVGEPPTPPHTPLREGQGPPTAEMPHIQPRPPTQQDLDRLQQQALHARMLGGTNMATLLTLAALQEGKGAAGPGLGVGGGSVPLPPTLDTHKSLPTTPTTPTSTAVSPSLASLSLSPMGSVPPSMVANPRDQLVGAPGALKNTIRDPLSKAPIDYTRYVKRFSSSLECGSLMCKELNHREHFHCLECSCKVFSKKEEMIRHFKWHKKRDESLQHGFMRYSPTDDCSDRFENCSHNHKQTHYHCLKEGCDKVYISTSDVQMHANYHRKDSAIMQEGFQRFRATEDCQQSHCPFSGQRTTHFHCMRTSCNFTFKNKADMEKHKTYHIKDEQLTKDGFKKFMKHEDCPYEGCKFSRIVNHIHCIRHECNYVLHSSGQIFAHKRKHERQDHERAYRKYKLAQTMLGVPEGHPALSPFLHEALRPLGAPPLGGSLGDLRRDDSSSPIGPGAPGGTPVPSGLPPSLQRPNPAFLMGPLPSTGMPPAPGDQHPLAKLLGMPPTAHMLFPPSTLGPTPTVTSTSGPASPVDLSAGGAASAGAAEENWERHLTHYGRDEPCRPACDLSGCDHWHCEECESVFRGREGSRDHGRIHEQQAQITEEHFTRVDPSSAERSPCRPDCPLQDRALHYHCNWEGCREVILASSDKPFQRLEHFRMHDYARRFAAVGSLAGAPPPPPPPPVGATHIVGGAAAAVTSVDSMFKRKRGRPPKNRIIEVWNDYYPMSSSHDTPKAIFTSFKLPKTSPPHPLVAAAGVVPPDSVPLLHGPQHPGLTPPLTDLSRDAESPNAGGPGVTPGSPNGHASTMTSKLLLGPNAQHLQQTSSGIFLIPVATPVLINPPQPKAEQLDGFYVFAEGSACPDQLCPLLGRRHYHCAHPRCLYVTEQADILVLHSRDFHENLPILDGFVAFDRNIDCRMPMCQSNKINKHFHCVRCGFSFLRHQIMEPHLEKHHEEESAAMSPNTTSSSTTASNGMPPSSMGHSLGPQSPIYLKKRPDSPMDNTPTTPSLPDTPSKGQDSSPPVVKSAGIFYPLSPFPAASAARTASSTSSPGGSMIRSEAGALVTPIPPSTRPQSTTTTTLSIPVSSNLVITASVRSPSSYMSPPRMERMDHEEDAAERVSADEGAPMGGNTLTRLLQTPTLDMQRAAEWLSPDRHPQYGPDLSCGRPFCKLKKKDHYHCQLCNQAFSEQEKLKPHLLKHTQGTSPSSALSPAPGSSTGADEEERGPDDEVIDENENSRPPHIAPDDGSERTRSPSTSSIGAGVCGSPRPPSAGMGMPQPATPQFPGSIVYSQGAGFPSFPPPFGPHFSMAGMFPGSLPRLMPPGWPAVHPAALAAMAHPGLMMSGMRPNGEMPAGVAGPGLPHASLAGATSNAGDSPLLPSGLSTSPHLALLGKRLQADDFPSQDAKKIRSNHTMRLLKDEPVPDGYVRFRFNEDCQYPHCGYREHQTHFHCMRKDCGYSFCDKTRFVQHTARHERLDTLMGGDFQQFRANVPCGRNECVYASMLGKSGTQNKASHFHCLKCDFVCTDTNKVVAHRRQHQKRDSINAAGFEKFTPSQPCGTEGCNHNQKQTHYHCLRCNYAVLGLSQMSAHRFRHIE